MKVIVECKDREGTIHGMHMMLSRREATESYVDQVIQAFEKCLRKKLGHEPIDLQHRVTEDIV